METIQYVPAQAPRIPYNKKLPILHHRQKGINDVNQNHFSLIIGPSQNGKDTFISSLDPNLEKYEHVKIGDGIQSCTKNFEYINYYCDKIIGKNKGYILNTVGLGDTKIDMLDHEIVTRIYSEVMQNGSSFSGGVHVFFFVQSLSDSPTNQIERSLMYMQAALGNAVFDSSVIIATKGNKILDPDDLENNMAALESLAQQYNIKGGVIDYRCPYKQFVKGIKKSKSSITDAEFIQQQSELFSCLQGLNFFDTKPLLYELNKEIQKILAEVKQGYKLVKVTTIKREETEKRFYTLWLYNHKVTYYDKEYETTFTKTDSEILEVAKQKVLAERIKELDSKLLNLKN